MSDEDSLKSLFSSKTKRDEISQMYSIWYKLRNPEKTGELDVAISDRDGHAVKSILNELIPMNKHFLNMTAERFSSLVNSS